MVLNSEKKAIENRPWKTGANIWRVINNWAMHCSNELKFGMSLQYKSRETVELLKSTEGQVTDGGRTAPNLEIV